MKTLKYLLTVIIAVLTANITMATEPTDDEDYVPVVREGVIWGHYSKHNTLNNGTFASKYVFYYEQLKGDTTINNKVYKKCYRYGTLGIGIDDAYGIAVVSFMREENKKVYLMMNRIENSPWANDVDSYIGYGYEPDEEYLVYDFNVSKVGDKMSLSFGEETVTRISKIAIGGKYRKIFSTNYGNIYIEGIGMVDGQSCDFGLPYGQLCTCFMVGYNRIIFEGNTVIGSTIPEIVYKTPYYFEINTYDYEEDDFYSKIGEVKANGKSRFATGGEGEIAINCQSDEVADYAVYDVKGAAVTQGTAVSGTTHIPIPAGAYIVKVGTQSQKVIVK